MTRREWAVRGAAVLAVPAALVLALLGVDVLRVPREVTAADLRFQSAPLRQQDRWKHVGFLPGDLGRRLLGAEDDLTYRRTAALYLRVQPGKVDYQGFPELEAARAKLEFELNRLRREEPDARRRSRILNLLGVTSLDRRFLGESERSRVLRMAAGSFQNAIELDPDNADAKLNLELAYRVFGPITFAGQAPSSGAASGRRSGRGFSGGGY